MKTRFTIVVICVSFLYIQSFSQLSNGGLHANFGVDADTKTNYLKYGNAAGNTVSDDWFRSASSPGYGIIDTNGTAYYKILLQNNTNISFTKRMRQMLYSKVGGTLWLDGIFGRDYIVQSNYGGGTASNDSSAFISSCKNGDNPNIAWDGGISNVPDKTDLLDVYAHMRRAGTNILDSLWFFSAASTIGVLGDRYYDVELFKNTFSYNSSTGKFSSSGTDGGHTAWTFNNSGQITQTGDMIISISYSPGSAPVIDLRIWVSQITYNTITPALFNFGGNYSGSTFGYANIVSKSGATFFGSGIANYSATSANDSTEAPPWGTRSNISSAQQWSSHYQSLQFIEIGLNLTRIGLDPGLYTAYGISPCTPSFKSVFFKSRTSSSFTANLTDFIAPLEFVREPILDYTLRNDTLSCYKSTGILTLTNVTTGGSYNWIAINGGNISGTNSDSTNIYINQPGKYIVQGKVANGCPVTRVDTITVVADNSQPIATAGFTYTPNLSQMRLLGGDSLASSFNTAFGGSGGLLWNWTGPNGFSSTVRNPITDTITGTYQLIVTEKRNGCKDTATIYINNIVLPWTRFSLKGEKNSNSTKLKWNILLDKSINRFEIYSSSDQSKFKLINSNFVNQIVSESNNFYFTDNNPAINKNYYFIKAITNDGIIVYSNIVMIDHSIKGNYYQIESISGSNIILKVFSDENKKGTAILYSPIGQAIHKTPINIKPGNNRFYIPINSSYSTGIFILALYEQSKITYIEKFRFK